MFILLKNFRPVFDKNNLIKTIADAIVSRLTPIKRDTFMNHISELHTTLAQFFNWNKARLTCLVHIIQALFCVRTINLAQIATAFQTDCKEESAYRRVCRFFTNFSFDFSCIAPFIFKVFPLDRKCTLILDRTNWKWGKTPINILMLSIAYRGISIPFFWSVLDLEGNSCTSDRISLLKRALQQFPLERIEAVVADREFVGKEWFSFLINTNIPFVIRVKGAYKVFELGAHKSISIHQLLKSRGRRKKVLNVPIEMWGFQLYLSFRKGKKGSKEPMILVSNYNFKDALKTYKNRWEIETLFGCLKSRGFRMEDTHITDPDKIEKILFVLAIAFCWAYRIGELKSKLNPIPQKKHGRKAKSVFRLGLDLVRRAFIGIGSSVKEIKQILSILFCFFREDCHV